MTTVRTDRRRRIILLAAVFVAVTSVRFSAEAVGEAASGYDPRPAKEAIARLGRFPRDVDDTVAAISKIPIGSWKVAYSCGFACMGKLCFRNLHYKSQVNFDSVKRDLERKLGTVKRSSSEFARYFTPMLRGWARKSLPTTGKAFDDAAKEVRAVQSEIKVSAVPTEARRIRVMNSLDRVSNSLSQGSRELTRSADVLVTYLQEQKKVQRPLGSWTSQMPRRIDGTARRIRQSMATSLGIEL